MEDNLLVVVDMVNGFINFGNLADKSINRIVPNVKQAIKQAKMKGYKIAAFKDCHSSNDIEFRQYPPHCIKGTAECELVPELKCFEKDMTIIEKPTVNGFRTQEFKRLIANNNFKNIFVCGCCSDICVFNFIRSLLIYKEQNKLGFNVYVIENAVDTFNAPNHNADVINKNAIKELSLFGNVLSIKVKPEQTKEN